ncbi:hypothetical protein BGZ61DRAFT_476555 [Ilyonectria robusta]|uniref:uncharacterized protein n=1 Tax=Ilyonectria robusta TaxID=1079257 RepID=UPI001E8CF077|nr:uncharacterized protein BGZ61DRAFT_476555 [Ilyonectria robusta]KAH8714483.1 hypothetical protein BGZ61DRAFT_476555 [Ilyonectria robusta]
MVHLPVYLAGHRPLYPRMRGKHMSHGPSSTGLNVVRLYGYRYGQWGDAVTGSFVAATLVRQHRHQTATKTTFETELAARSSNRIAIRYYVGPSPRLTNQLSAPAQVCRPGPGLDKDGSTLALPVSLRDIQILVVRSSQASPEPCPFPRIRHGHWDSGSFSSAGMC